MGVHHPFLPLLPGAACALLALAACSQAPAPTPAADAAAAPAATAPATTPGPGAMAELTRALDGLGEVRSYHATMQLESGAKTIRSELDFVAPDRFRMVMPGLGTQVIIGDTMYMQAGGQSMRMDVPAGTLDQWRDPARLDDPARETQVQALGRETLDGQSTRKFLVRSQQAGTPAADITMWIGPDDLPLQVRVASTSGDATTSTIRYSRFNDPSIEITPPQ